jgi:hypothetical protein
VGGAAALLAVPVNSSWKAFLGLKLLHSAVTEGSYKKPSGLPKPCDHSDTMLFMLGNTPDLACLPTRTMAQQGCAACTEVLEP